MGDVRGFLKEARKKEKYRKVCERIQDFNHVVELPSEAEMQEQALRCMDCGTPFCHWACPVGNYIPEWNDYMFSGNWKAALRLLTETNDMPEVTGRICPALCESACVLGLNNDAVSIRENELTIIEHGFRNGLIKAKPVGNRTGKAVAVVGSGPAGLACAREINRMGHDVVVFERDNKPGGLLRYGIPDFKLEKHIIDRRIDLWKEEGVVFKTGVEVGKDYPTRRLLKEFDAVCVAGGSRVPRDMEIEGRDLKGIHFAMGYLSQANRIVAGEKIPKDEILDAKGKKVVVIGGGDTGSDAIGTAVRQGAACIVQIEVMPKPPECRGDDYPWPRHPLVLKTTSSHEEAGDRQWRVLTKKFSGKNGHVKKLSCVNVLFSGSEPGTCPVMKEIPGSAFEIEADMVILAIGFLHPEQSGMLADLGVVFDERGNVKTDDNYKTSVDKVFAAGDMRRGQSLVVWALSEGRMAAESIDKYLTD